MRIMQERLLLLEAELFTEGVVGSLLLGHEGLMCLQLPTAEQHREWSLQGLS